MSKVNTHRRAFLRGAYLTREGRNEEAKRQKPLGPTLPWHQTLPLETQCIDCAHPCETACEPGVIQIHPHSHRLAGVPYLNFEATGCTFCRACVEACPLDIEIQHTPAPRIGTLTLNRDSCIAWDDIICMSCSNRCDYKAISTSHQRRAQINADICTGCGMCVAVCPVNALSIV